MDFLRMFGDNVEDVLGSVLFLPSYLICGVAGTCLHYAFNADSMTPCLGASGAISGAVGMYMVFFPRVKVDLQFYFWWFSLWSIKVTAIIAGAVWLGEQPLLGLFGELYGWKDFLHVAFWSHVGGLLTGIALGLIYRWLGVPARYFESIGGEIQEYMACAVCGTEERQLPEGEYRCGSCNSLLSIDAKGEVHVVKSSRTVAQVEAAQKRGSWIIAVIALSAITFALIKIVPLLRQL